MMLVITLVQRPKQTTPQQFVELLNQYGFVGSIETVDGETFIETDATLALTEKLAQDSGYDVEQVIDEDEYEYNVYGAQRW